MSVCMSVSEQNSSQTGTPIWTRFLLNGCLRIGSISIEIGEPWVKGQVGHSELIFFPYTSINFPILYLSSLKSYQNEIWCVA